MQTLALLQGLGVAMLCPMATRFLSELLTPDVLAAQEAAYGRHYTLPGGAPADELGEDEVAFLADRDSFYLGTVSSSGWPYVQHRGGPKGFLKVVDEKTLGFADLKGNRQLVSTGNLSANDRVALFLMDYPGRQRLKILGHARTVDAKADPALADRLAPTPELRSRVERVVLVDVVGFDWNCPAYITPRFTEEEVEAYARKLHARIADLERQLAAAKA